MSTSASTVVLVHGAWHGAWCWDEVGGALGARGIVTRSVELPSTLRGDVGFADDVSAVRGCLDEASGPVLLVGHSYGGAVVTEAGEHPAVHALVYVAGFNLTEDESASAAAADEASGIDHRDRPGLELVEVGPGRMAVTPESAREVFFNDSLDAVADAAIGRLRPQQMSCLSESPAAVAWTTRPSTYVVCERDQAVHPDLQRILARRATRTATLPSGHSPFLSMPADLADVIGADATRR